MARPRIPVSVIVTTRNEERRIGRCLEALRDFDEIIVVDSHSADSTQEIARAKGVSVIDFVWNGRYPKKRQWCLDNLALKHEWVFFVDADEIVTEQLAQEIRGLHPLSRPPHIPPPSPHEWGEGGGRESASADSRGEGVGTAGYFVPGVYLYEGKALRYGLRNNKLALIDRRAMEFPVVDDIGAPGMGEIEGHYQPVLKNHGAIGQLKSFLLHDAYDDAAAWTARHEGYAAWELEMNKRRAWPQESRLSRRVLKNIFKAAPFRAAAAFAHCYLLKLGFLDGARGFRFAKSRYDYYKMISGRKISGASKRAA